MLKLMPLAILVALILSCGRADLAEIVSIIERETGLPVENKTMDHDTCTLQQLKQIGLEYNKLDKTAQQNVLAKIKSDYAKITIEKSEVSVKQTGKLITLVHFEMICSDDNCWYEEIDRKVISDARSVEGERKPSVITTENKTLALKVYSELSAYESVEMMTTKTGLYEQIESIDDPIYADAIEKKAVYERRTRVMNDLKCTNTENLIDSML